MPESKLFRLEDLRELVPAGGSVALGGAWMSNRPMAAVRQLLRSRVGDLHIIGQLLSLDVDLLVGAGLVSELTFSMVSLEAFGLAPQFRAAAQARTVRLNEITGVAMGVAFEAAARNVPFLPMPGVGATELLDVTPYAYGIVTCPFTDAPVRVMRAIAPDVAIIHVRRADAKGNCQVDGPLANDPVLALASRRVIVTCEEIVETAEIAANPAATHIPGFLVHAVIETPFGAHPSSHIPQYAYDAWSVMDYVDQCSEGGAERYLQRLAEESESDYVERVLDDERRMVLSTIAATAPILTEVVQ